MDNIVVGPEQIAISFCSELRATRLERTLAIYSASDEERWQACLQATMVASARDRVFPPLCGPLSVDEQQRSVWHLVPSGSMIFTPDGQFESDESPQSLDLLSILPPAARLLTEIVEESATNRALPGTCCMEPILVLVPRSRLWLLPCACANEPQGAGPLLAAIRRLFAKVTPTATEEEVFDELMGRLAGLAEQDAAPDYFRPLAETLQPSVEHLGLIVDAPADIQPPACGQCQEPILSYAPQCPGCGKSWPEFNEFCLVRPDWLLHPRAGLLRCVRIPISRFKRLPLPTTAEINALLEQHGQHRVLKVVTANEQNRATASHTRVAVLILAAAAAEGDLLQERVVDQLMPILWDSGQQELSQRRRTRAPLERVQLFEDNSGARCTWRANIAGEATVHIWWSSESLPEGDWDDLNAAADHRSTCPANESWFTIELDDPQWLHVAVGLEEEGARTALCRVDEPLYARPARRKSADAAIPAPTQAAPVVKPATKTCPACSAQVPGNRDFCTGCGTFLANVNDAEESVTEPAGETEEPFERQEELERLDAGARWSILRNGVPAELLESTASGPLEELITSLAAHQADVSLLPQVEEVVTTSSGFQAIVEATPADDWITLRKWLQQLGDRTAAYARLSVLLPSLLEQIAGMHQRGFAFGLLTDDRVMLRRSDEQLRLLWPLSPLRLGEPAPSATAWLGYVCPEFGDPQAAAHPSWDIYSLAVAWLWGIAGRIPSESLSDRQLPTASVRSLLADLPAGWGGWFQRALAKPTDERFESAASALLALPTESVDEQPPALRFRLAAGLHVGVSKFTRNPRNQDRVAVCGPAGVVDLSVAETFAEFDSSESFVSSELQTDGPLLAAVIDGISTAQSGEFAAQEIASSVHAFAASQELGGQSEPLLRELFDFTNQQLGESLAQAVVNDEALAVMLRPATSPSATLAALHLSGGERGGAACVGDSRVYLLRGGLLEQLTVDGDQLTLYLQQGRELGEAMGRDDHKELISWIGRFDLDPNQEDRVDPHQPRSVANAEGFHLLTFQPQPGDIYCCCSDGISDFVDAGLIDLKQTLEQHLPQPACRSLIDAANDCGGLDNISVVVVHAMASVQAAAPP